MDFSRIPSIRNRTVRGLCRNLCSTSWRRISSRLPPAPLVPCPNLYAQLNALQLVLDPRSLVWINLFALDLRQSLEQFMEIYKLSDSQKPEEHVDIKVDGLMLKVRGKMDTWTSFKLHLNALFLETSFLMCHLFTLIVFVFLIVFAVILF